MSSSRSAAPSIVASCSAALFFSCGDAGQAPQPVPHVHVASASCPEQSPTDWQAFLERTVEDEHWVRTCSDLGNCQELVGEFGQHVERDVLGTFAACTQDLLDNPRIARCTERLRRYIPAWQAQHSDDSYGFAAANPAYFAAQVRADRPAGMMDPPPALLAALPLRTSLEAAARDNGWPYLVHDSCLGGIRFIVTVPDPAGRFDQWLLFGLDEARESVGAHPILSFIAIERRDAAGGELARVRLHFRDYLATSVDGAWRVELPENTNGKCYACHTSGLRQLVPFSGIVADSAPVRGEEGFGSREVEPGFGLQRLARLNAQIDAYGLPDWEGMLAPEDHGPPLDAELGCTRCHDGETRGVLTVSTSEGMLHQKVVAQLAMRASAPGVTVPDSSAMSLLEREQTGAPPLSEAERLELEAARAAHLADYQRLAANRFPAWRAWTLAEACE